MDDLIKALEILRRYGNPHNPTHCEHDELTVCINPIGVHEEDKEELDRLGFLQMKKRNVSNLSGLALANKKEVIMEKVAIREKWKIE